MKKVFKNQVFLSLSIALISYISFLYFDYYFPETKSKIDLISAIFKILLTYGIVLIGARNLFVKEKLNKMFVLSMAIYTLFLGMYITMDMTSYISKINYENIESTSKGIYKDLKSQLELIKESHYNSYKGDSLLTRNQSEITDILSTLVKENDSLRKAIK